MKSDLRVVKVGCNSLGIEKRGHGVWKTVKILQTEECEWLIGEIRSVMREIQNVNSGTTAASA